MTSLGGGSAAVRVARTGHSFAAGRGTGGHGESEATRCRRGNIAEGDKGVGREPVGESARRLLDTGWGDSAGRIGRATNPLNRLIELEAGYLI